jgi:Polyprenyl synthetase
MSAAATASVLEAVVARVDAILEAFLGDRHAEAVAIDPRTAEPVEEIQRLVRAGGKRLRPACTYWGYRAAGGDDGPEIWRAAAAVELLHTMALLHDDVMDADDERRGEPTARARQIAAARARGQGEPERVGVAVAIVAGDLAAAFAEQLFSTAGFSPDRQFAGAARLARMRLELALGAYLSVADLGVDPATVAYLKGGAYTVGGGARGRPAGGGGGASSVRAPAGRRLPDAGRSRRRRRGARHLAGAGRGARRGLPSRARRPTSGPERRRRARRRRDPRSVVVRRTGLG